VVNIWVNSAKGVEIQLSSGQLAKLATKPMSFHFSRAGAAGVKITLVELLLGKSLPPYQPAGAEEPKFDRLFR
jgi:hypothetical protein